MGCLLQAVPMSDLRPRRALGLTSWEGGVSLQGSWEEAGLVGGSPSVLALLPHPGTSHVGSHVLPRH